MTTKTRLFSWISAAFFVLALGCVVASMLIDTTIDANGFLQEPFYLIPIFGLCVLLGLVSGVIAIIIKNKVKRQAMSR
ncbi:MAG: DUF3955 domain-containing protein [Anaerolineaceae bacterium]|nr:DUF3955 domain-containing protein [Anaerolineaceae bacterium]